MANIHGNLGLALAMTRQFSLAQRHLLEALRLFRSLHIPSEEAACLANLGYYYKEYAVRATGVSKRARLERLNSALSYASAAHALKLRTAPPRRIALSAHDVGEIHALLGHRPEAVKWLESALDGFGALGLERYAADVQKTLDQLG
jgi:tetratricopeptide (TPR) repeat protein